ncbi:DUF5615 family PIN-like protein [Thiohalocapsa sp. ML1]|uniref:DUF5615 family PIN-like protein n=1 Tax=Thiohalocapsa sp. ML1 TaxID=1431688 RepID=UPI000732060B|nr:DUF5615 family PIN-like protein [Thiohalocapsa sp. ML1]
MNLLLDMNLSPAWKPLLEAHGWHTQHWSEVGAVNAADAEIMAWAKAHGCYVITNDLDFSAILAATWASGPSVVQSGSAQRAGSCPRDPGQDPAVRARRRA